MRSGLMVIYFLLALGFIWLFILTLRQFGALGGEEDTTVTPSPTVTTTPIVTEEPPPTVTPTITTSPTVGGNTAPLRAPTVAP
jgi:hypothetical protein